MSMASVDMTVIAKKYWITYKNIQTGPFDSSDKAVKWVETEYGVIVGSIRWR